MCKCTPNIKTPFCGKPECEWPQQEKEREFIEKNPLTYFISNGDVVGAFHFDRNHFGEKINYRIGQIIDSESRLYEILAETSDDEFNEIKRAAEIKYHQQRIKELENIPTKNVLDKYDSKPVRRLSESF